MSESIQEEERDGISVLLATLLSREQQASGPTPLLAVLLAVAAISASIAAARLNRKSATAYRSSAVR